MVVSNYFGAWKFFLQYKVGRFEDKDENENEN